MDFGCLTNCFPAFIPLRLALLVAAISERDSPLKAADGRERSPVFRLGLPEDVRHLWLVQSTRLLCCGFIWLSCSRRPVSCSGQP